MFISDNYKSIKWFCLQFPKHQYNVTTRVIKTLSSLRKSVKTPKRSEGILAALLGGSLAIITSFSDDIFDAMTNVAHQHEVSSDDNGNKHGSSGVISTPPRVGISKVATTLPKMSLFKISWQILQLDFLVNFEFVDSLRARCESFCGNPIIFTVNPTKGENHSRERNICII